jgi:hypothetical protein
MARGDAAFPLSIHRNLSFLWFQSAAVCVRCGYQDLRGEATRQVAMQLVFELYSALCIEASWSGEVPGCYVKALVTGPSLEMLVGWDLAAFQRRRE